LRPSLLVSSILVLLVYVLHLSGHLGYMVGACVVIVLLSYLSEREIRYFGRKITLEWLGPA
jgi:hypothetical protein